MFVFFFCASARIIFIIPDRVKKGDFSAFYLSGLISIILAFAANS